MVLNGIFILPCTTVIQYVTYVYRHVLALHEFIISMTVQAVCMQLQYCGHLATEEEIMRLIASLELNEDGHYDYISKVGLFLNK